MQNKLRITRYNKTRYWAIWANEELLAVTVYMKGAQAVLNYIHTITNPTTYNTTMAKTKSVNAAATTATATADFDPTIIKAVNGEGKTIRIKFDPLGVSVCYNLKGKWQADEIYNEPLPQLVAEGIFTIEDEKSLKTYDKYFNSGKKSKRKIKSPIIQVVTPLGKNMRVRLDFSCTTVCTNVQGKWHTDGIYPQSLPELIAEGLFMIEDEKSQKVYKKYFDKQASVKPQMQVESLQGENEASLQVADEAAEEAAIWQEIEEEREQERFMEAQDAATEQEPQSPKLHKTCNVVLNGEEQARPIPEGYVPAAGDLLIRNYKSEVVEVVVKAKGQYEWNGEIYPTLTHISWKVAGYQISGNTFFGLPIKPRKG